MAVFESIRDAEIAQAIRAAHRRVLFVAPGLSEPVADALCALMDTAPPVTIAIVLDSDEECCRLGYGDAHALAAVAQSAHRRSVPLRQHPGIRLCLLVADDETLIWTPSPLMFEPPRGKDEPNGLRLTVATLEQIPEALGISVDGSALLAEVGTRSFASKQVDEIVESIKAVPPAPFDLSRLSRVFSSKFQFVETEVKGAEFMRREIRLDSLIVNSDAPEALRSILQTTIKPFSAEADREIPVPVFINGVQAFTRAGEPMLEAKKQAEIHRYWNDLCAKYIVNLPGFGKLIRYADKTAFEREREAFETMLQHWVTGFRYTVRADHEQRVADIVKLLERRMELADPQSRRKRDDIDSLVRSGLDRLRVIEPAVKVVYKNVAIESTRDKEFIEALKRALPKKDLDGWFEVFDAARAVPMQPR